MEIDYKDLPELAKRIDRLGRNSYELGKSLALVESFAEDMGKISVNDLNSSCLMDFDEEVSVANRAVREELEKLRDILKRKLETVNDENRSVIWALYYLGREPIKVKIGEPKEIEMPNLIDDPVDPSDKDTGYA